MWGAPIENVVVVVMIEYAVHVKVSRRQEALEKVPAY